MTRQNGWLATRRWRPSTRDCFDSHWRQHVQPRWGTSPLVAIRPTEVQGWINDLETGGLSASYVEAIYRRLVSILTSAQTDGIITRQPVTGLSLPVRTNANQVHVPTPEQVDAMAQAVGERYRTLVWTCATLGLRPAEAVGLTVERIDFLERLVTIDRQLITPSRGQPHFSALKTAQMPSRDVPATPELIDQLAAHLTRYPPVEHDAPKELGGSGRLIFTNNEARPIRRGGLGYTWNKAAQETSLPNHLRGWHSLRHYAITRLISAGINPDYVRQFAGHSTLTETLNTYSGWWPSDADDARLVLAEALAATRISPDRQLRRSSRSS